MSIGDLLMRHFFYRDFIFFLICGTVSALLCLACMVFFSFFLSDFIAYICGYFCSVCFNYLLNCKLIFKQKAEIKNFLKFILSYIPNFMIQMFLLVFLTGYFAIPFWSLCCLTIILATAITWLFVKLFAFSENKLH